MNLKVRSGVDGLDSELEGRLVLSINTVANSSLCEAKSDHKVPTSPTKATSARQSSRRQFYSLDSGRPIACSRLRK